MNDSNMDKVFSTINNMREKYAMMANDSMKNHGTFVKPNHHYALLMAQVRLLDEIKESILKAVK